MPNWDFKCALCDAVTEHHIKEGEEFPKCDKCNVTLTKIYSAPGIHFKGTGWGFQ